MKKVSLEECARVKGGWSWSQHLGCALAGAVVGAGVGGAAAYVGCLLVLDNNCSLCCGSLCGPNNNNTSNTSSSTSGDKK